MKALTNKELTYFCSQMALILKSGISSTEGLALMLEDTPEGEGRDLLQALLHDMEEGAMLYQALQFCFPCIYVQHDRDWREFRTTG